MDDVTIAAIILVLSFVAIILAWMPAILTVRRMALDAEAEVKRRALTRGETT